MRRLLGSLDLGTGGIALALASAGLLAIASATADQAGREGLWKMQLAWIAIACTVAIVIAVVDYHIWASVALLLHAVAIALLVAVLFVGREVGGNQSWLVFGPLRLQPSEFAKWTTCLVCAGYLATRGQAGIGLRQMVELGVLVGTPTALIALQPDFGTALIFGPVYLAAVWLGGLRWRVIGGVLLVGVLLAPVGWTQLKSYQKERILAVLDAERDPAGVGYQVRQSKIAIGSGGLAGKGLFQGTQSQLNFLPAQHTDFVLAVIAEELGFFGACAVLGLFLALLNRGIGAASRSQDRLGTYVCLLIVAWLATQMAINIGMVLGRLPTIGVPLPLVSYGGSALVAAMAAVGLLMNVRSRRFVN